jgi:hypothetical protein
VGNVLEFLLEFANSNVLDDKDKQIVNNIFNYIEKDTIFKICYKLVNESNFNNFKKIAFDASLAMEKLIFSLEQYHYIVSLEKDVVSKIDVFLFYLIDKYGLKEMPKNILERYNKDAKQLRAQGGLELTPQLIIYMIDKESKAKETSKRRKNLEAPEDIVGLCLNIPGRKQGVNYSKSIAIKLENINPELDLEDTDED